MIQYAYPRLDINVTKGLNHLLKSPFCIHPKTGKICTPFNPRTVEKFNPDTVPTINQLMAEVNEYDAELQKHLTNEEFMQTRGKDYKKTSLVKSIQVFDEFIRKLEDANPSKIDTAMEF
ncbi:hypothetical protein RUM43_005442 [Polyplax serrata]|uniref:DNA primase small subunit n=1 Tax=Polyplax serrata TaxID=468196 RepID=A0AAN8RUP1_POLSC